MGKVYIGDGRETFSDNVRRKKRSEFSLLLFLKEEIEREAEFFCGSAWKSFSPRFPENMWWQWRGGCAFVGK